MNGDDYSHKKRTPRISFNTSKLNTSELLVTATSGRNGTQIFVNGVLAKSKRDLMLKIPRNPGDDTKLVIGNSVYGTHSWAGEIYGLAYYDYIISERKVADHYRGWMAENSFTFAWTDRPNLLYLFDEIRGHTVYEHARRTSPLKVPNRFTVLKWKLLDYQIDNIENPWNVILDVCINIIGFVPFGFVLVLVLQRVGGRLEQFRLWSAVFAGFLLSLSIEIAQVWLPSRSSSALDLALNTFGTYAGALLGIIKTRRILVTNFARGQ